MNKLYIKPTKSSPEILFDPTRNFLSIKGESYPEYPFKFFGPIFEWLENNINKLNDGIIMEISLSYLNTSSSKSIMSILDIVDEAYNNGKNIIVNWIYDKNNELTYDIAENFKDYVDLPINIIEKDDYKK